MSEQLEKALSELTVLEMSNLVKSLEELWGVSAAAPAAVAQAPAQAEAVEEKTEFDVVLVEGDAAKKLAIIKALRAAVSGIGLKEAKDMVESSNVVIKEALPKAEAESIKKQLEEAGAKIKLA